MQRLRTLHLFAGAGGGILADILLGHQPVCAVEINSYCQQVLSARQKDGGLPWFPIFADVEKFDGRPWRGLVDVVSGGFPCQDISTAGRGAGIDGERSGLWAEFARIIGEVRPRFVFVENSPALTSRGLGRVLGDLAEMGFDAEWGVLGADDVGAPHRRKRIWIMANASSERHEFENQAVRPGRNAAELRGKEMAHPASQRQPRQGQPEQRMRTARPGEGEADRPEPVGIYREWPPEPDVGRVADGVARKLDQPRTDAPGEFLEVGD